MNAPVETAAIPRGIYTGTPLGRPHGNQRFYQCHICGGWVDGANLQQVTEHEGTAPPAIDVVVAQAS